MSTFDESFNKYSTLPGTNFFHQKEDTGPIAAKLWHRKFLKGWDNPNVFVMCMLKHSDNTISRRQEVGRGLRLRDLALFNLAIDSKLRGCDLVKLSVADLVKDDRVRERVSVIQNKTKKPVQFEVTENTRDTVIAWVKSPEMIGCRFMFPSRFHDRSHISTRQYGRLVRDWVTSIGVEPSGYTRHTQCAEPKLRRFTARRATFAPCNFC